MDMMASQITSLTIVYSTVYLGADQRKHQSSASLAFVLGIHWSPVNSYTNGQRCRKYFHSMTSSWEMTPYCLLSEVHPMNHTHGFVVLCFVVLYYQFLVLLCDGFTCDLHCYHWSNHISFFPLTGAIISLIARFMGPTWGPSGAERAERTQVGPMLAPWTLLSGYDWSNDSDETMKNKGTTG